MKDVMARYPSFRHLSNFLKIDTKTFIQGNLLLLSPGSMSFIIKLVSGFFLGVVLLLVSREAISNGQEFVISIDGLIFANLWHNKRSLADIYEDSIGICGCPRHFLSSYNL